MIKSKRRRCRGRGKFLVNRENEMTLGFSLVFVELGVHVVERMGI